MNATNIVQELIEDDAKSISSVLPEIIRILEEGDATTRISKMLLANGWTGMDAWREFKSVPLPSPITTDVINDLMGADKGIEIYNKLSAETKTLRSHLRSAKRKSSQ